MAASNIGDTFPTKYGIALVDTSLNQGVIAYECEPAKNEDLEDIWKIASKKIFFGNADKYTIKHIEQADMTLILFNNEEVLSITDQTTMNGNPYSPSEIAVEFNNLIIA